MGHFLWNFTELLYGFTVLHSMNILIWHTHAKILAPLLAAPRCLPTGAVRVGGVEPCALAGNGDAGTTSLFTLCSRIAPILPGPTLWIWMAAVRSALDDADQ
jgi:hypothetical protein